MPLVSKQSLETLKEKIDLVDIISSFVKLSKSGSHYKGLCPFHNEKSPSFSISLGDKHYHCFGCGAHGDAISFLMEYSKLSFKDALNFLSEKYAITLDHDKDEDGTRVIKSQIKEALLLAEDFYHFCLLHTYEGQKALKYAQTRKLEPALLEQFKMGYSPKNGLLFKYLKSQGVDPKIMIEAGLYHAEKKADFFFDRFMIPIHEPMGACIGFSARKLDEETFGGKYINTPETALFKKSHLLFGLKFSRVRIIKEKKAIICEGQIDAMRLIHEGYDYTVASQGTAFGIAHVDILKKLGVTMVYLAFDADHAGIQAAIKVGDFFIKEQISVQVLGLPTGQDPDSFLIEKGKKAFDELMLSSKSYLEFIYDALKIHYDLDEPSEKNRFIQDMKKRIIDFKDPVLIHESLKKLSQLSDIPERLLGVSSYKAPRPKISTEIDINKDHILEMDVIRFYYLAKLQNVPFLHLFHKNPLEFQTSQAQRLFKAITVATNLDMMPFMSELDVELHADFETLFEKKINRLKLLEGVKGVIYKLLERSWLQKRQQIQSEIEKADNEKDQLKLTLKMTLLLKSPPKLEGLDEINN